MAEIPRQWLLERDPERLSDTWSFDAVGKCLPLVHYFHANFRAMGG
jgi:hypothetical protein